MNPLPRPDEQVLADAWGDYASRRARGDTPSTLEYRERLGDSHPAFLDLVEMETFLGEFLDPPGDGPLPRPFGPYTLVREIGRGAMGVVYEAVHRQLDRRVAVKVMRPGTEVEPSVRGRFHDEPRAGARVSHPNVVEIHDVGVAEGRPYYAMKFLDGEPLSVRLARRALDDPRALARAMAGVADGLAALHAQGVLHRDVKPSNILCTREGPWVLTDFGHARVGDGLGLTSTGQALGTPHYAAPEVLLGRRGGVDARADVYSLGATLYEALTGRHLYPHEEYADLVRDVLDPDVRPAALRRVAPQVDPALARIVMQAVEKRPEDRQADAAALRDDLRAFADGRLRDVVAGPVSPPERARRAVRDFVGRHVLALAAGVLAVLGAGWWWTHRPATVRIECVPEVAQASIDGVERGATPLALELPPGTYLVTVRHERFLDRTRVLTVSAGLRSQLDFALVPKDPADPIARDLLLLASGVPVEDIPRAVARRSRSGADLVPLWPRGDVRLEDLADFAVEAPGFPDDGVIEFVRGGAEVLGAVPFEAETPFVRGSVPAAVRDALRVGDDVRWGWRPRRAKPGALARETSAKFRVVASDADARIAAALVRVGEQPAPVLAEIRLRILRQQGLATAVLRAVEDLPAGAADDPWVLALAQLAYDGLGLEESARAAATAARLAALPPEVLERVHGSPAPPK